MKKKETPRPTEAELEILQILWDQGPSSVRTVNDQLNEKRDVGYTTTLKMMQIMLDKGLLKRNAEKRTHIYTANIDRDQTQRQLLQRFIQDAFQGSTSKLVMQILGSSIPSDKELDEIKAMIKDYENKRS